MSETPDLTTFALRLYFAADIVQELNQRRRQGSAPQCGDDAQWSWAPCELRRRAAAIEAEDRAAAEREELVEQLARELFEAIRAAPSAEWSNKYDYVRSHYVHIARSLVGEYFWRKGEPA